MAERPRKTTGFNLPQLWRECYMADEADEYMGALEAENQRLRDKITRELQEAKVVMKHASKALHYKLSSLEAGAISAEINAFLARHKEEA